MATNQKAASDRRQSGSAVYVRTDSAAKILDDILRKPGKHGHTPQAVENKRRHIGAGTCKPGEATLICLANNGCLDEYIAALTTLLDPGSTESDGAERPITESARRVTRAERALGEPVEDLFLRRATARDYAMITREAHVLEEESEQLSRASARVQYGDARKVS